MTDGHTITITPAQAHVEAWLDGVQLAKSDRAVKLEETGLAPRYYLPAEDVQTDLLEPTGTHTTCPFKGEASYWSVRIGDQVHQDVVWSYQQPIPAADGIAGLLCFYTERGVEQTVS
jgi:uncharacterized protein (DUF427 family)